MRKESLAFLEELVNTPSPTSYETRGQRVWLDYVNEFADKVAHDEYGNCVATLNPGGGPRIMLAGHADEIALSVNYIDDKGLVSIAAVDSESGKAAIKWINEIVEEPEIGKIYEGKVVKLMDFGAFVNFMGSKDGLVHISQLKYERVEKVSDIVNEGDLVKVKVLDIDSRGKVKLSMKEVEAE